MNRASLENKTFEASLEACTRMLTLGYQQRLSVHVVITPARELTATLRSADGEVVSTHTMRIRQLDLFEPTPAAAPEISTTPAEASTVAAPTESVSPAEDPPAAEPASADAGPEAAEYFLASFKAPGLEHYLHASSYAHALGMSWFPEAPTPFFQVWGGEGPDGDQRAVTSVRAAHVPLLQEHARQAGIALEVRPDHFTNDEHGPRRGDDALGVDSLVHSGDALRRVIEVSETRVVLAVRSTGPTQTCFEATTHIASDPDGSGRFHVELIPAFNAAKKRNPKPEKVATAPQKPLTTKGIYAAFVREEKLDKAWEVVTAARWFRVPDGRFTADVSYQEINALVALDDVLVDYKNIKSLGGRTAQERAQEAPKKPRATPKAAKYSGLAAFVDKELGEASESSMKAENVSPEILPVEGVKYALFHDVKPSKDPSKVRKSGLWSVVACNIDGGAELAGTAKTQTEAGVIQSEHIVREGVRECLLFSPSARHAQGSMSAAHRAYAVEGHWTVVASSTSGWHQWIAPGETSARIQFDQARRLPGVVIAALYDPRRKSIVDAGPGRAQPSPPSKPLFRYGFTQVQLKKLRHAALSELVKLLPSLVWADLGGTAAWWTPDPLREGGMLANELRDWRVRYRVTPLKRDHSDEDRETLATGHPTSPNEAAAKEPPAAAPEGGAP